MSRESMLGSKNNSKQDFAPEFRLALSCIHWPLRPQDREQIRDLTKAPLDWAWFERIIEAHQVLPLVYRNLRLVAADSMPGDVAARLHDNVLLTARRSLAQSSELARLVELLEDAGISSTTLKGAPLSIIAFGDLALRRSIDIDILIDQSDLFATEHLLFQSGYRKTTPKAELTPRRLKYYMKYHKDFIYYSEARGITVELHWRLFQSTFLPMQSGVDALSTIRVNLGTKAVNTLSGDDLFVYLCIHGAIHAWESLKWLADLAALLAAMTETDLRSAIARASTLGALAELSAGLILVRRLLDIDRYQPELLDDTNPAVRRIVALSSEFHSANKHCHTHQQIPGVRMFWYTVFLRPSWRYRIACMIDHAVLPGDWERINLPDALFPLYLGIRPFSWLIRRRASAIPDDPNL